MNQRLVIMIGILVLSGVINAEEPANKPAASSTENTTETPVEKKRDPPGTMTFELCQRKLLNKSYEGFYVQDFYLGGEKFTDPYLIKEEKDFTGGDCSKAIAKKNDENFSLDYTNYATIMPSIQGSLVRWHKNKALYSREIYENGDIQGLQETKFDNGQVEFRANYLNGLFNGEVVFMTKNGDKKSRSFYKNSKRDGLSTIWFDDGKTRVEVKYIDGVLQESYTSFYTANDQKKAQGKINKQQEKIGSWQHWYENGQLSQKEAFNDQGKREGLWTYWHNNGMKYQEGSYVNGDLADDWEVWDDRGKPLQFIKVKEPENNSPIESEETPFLP